MKKYSYIQKSINVLNHIKELKDKNHMAILPMERKVFLDKGPIKDRTRQSIHLIKFTHRNL